MPYHIYSPNI